VLRELRHREGEDPGGAGRAISRYSPRARVVRAAAPVGDGPATADAGRRSRWHFAQLVGEVNSHFRARLGISNQASKHSPPGEALENGRVMRKFQVSFGGHYGRPFSWGKRTSHQPVKG